MKYFFADTNMIFWRARSQNRSSIVFLKEEGLDRSRYGACFVVDVIR